MNQRLLTMVVFILLTVLAVTFFTRMRKSSAPDPVTLHAIEFGPGRVIRITVEPNSQQTLSLHYHVDVAGEMVVEHAFFGTLPRTSPPPSFLTYTAAEGDLIGLAQEAAPNRIVILHDFATGDSFPHRSVTYKDSDTRKSYPYYEDEGPILARGEALFARLSADPTDPPLELLRTMASRPLTLPIHEPLPE